MPRTPRASRLRCRRPIVAYAVIDAAHLDDAFCNRGHLRGRRNRRTVRFGWAIVPFHGVDCCGGDEDSQRGNRPLRKTVAPPIIWEASWWKRPRVAKRYPFARPHPPGTHHTAGFSRRSPPRPSKSPTDAPFGCCGSCPGSATEETPSRAPPVAALNNVTEVLRE